MRWIYDACGNADFEEVAHSRRRTSRRSWSTSTSPTPEGRYGRCDVFWGAW